MNENNSLILSLIKNNFGYTEESISFIENQLEKHTSSEYIESLFSDAIDDRKYFPISLNFKEKIDAGWVLFKKFFLDFASFYEMTYSDFVENKIVINKNSLKLKKALVAYYLKKYSETSIKSSINLRTIQAPVLMNNSVEDSRELLFVKDKNGGLLCILSFEEDIKSFNFLNIIELRVMNGVRRFEGSVELKGAVSLKNEINVKGSVCNKIAFLKNEREDFVSFYVNKISENGLSFFRREKLSQEISNKYFSNSTFLTTTNDDRMIKLFFINEERNLSSVVFTINQESGELSFSEEIISDLKIDLDINSFSVIVKEKHSEFFFSLKNENNETVVAKFITENGINFVSVEQDFSQLVAKQDKHNVFYKDLSISITDNGYATINRFNTAKNSIPEEVRKSIDEDINQKLEVVGTKSLPKNKEISVVISKNFADWFLCSTAETWSSCLNLESQHSACHWQGLPALLGDKNRVMFYITDGTKKTYKGIVVDKLLSRTWGLLDDKNKFNAIKFYPLEILDMEDLFSITKIPVNLIDRKFVSKEPLDLIFYKYTDRFYCSSFIFQDKTQFVKMNDGYHLSFGSSNGFYSVVTDLEKGKESIKPISLFDYTEGFGRLKDKDLKITNYFKSLALSDEVCTRCGNRIREGNHSHNIEGVGTYCSGCFRETHFSCHVCNNTYRKRENYYITVRDANNDEVEVCEDCRHENVINCDICKEPILKELAINYKNENNEKLNICNGCLVKKEDGEEIGEQCFNCGTFFHKDVVEKNNMLHDYRERIYCGKCLFEMSDRLQAKFSFYVE